ncbi:DUF6580 family putative transport protein [Cystobacter ferrugineus]|uniref:Uncharacterized protein n=1 Tax=Cystobacter ferrugineus TaxID=83449 RepID=A0A1L9AYW2_9BACT|nr:DUF6580 family putative transport protein [Cystobacter ferrugineus]OJH35194.1 hypothetical protein BON30_39755 [Cystobacter ferrugineus]
MKAWMTEVGMFSMLVALGVAGRLLPHEPNFMPIAATALFSGYFMRHVSFAACVPLASMLISDAVLGVYDYKVMGVVYLCLMAPVLLSAVLKRRLTVTTVGAGAVGSSALFFVGTNFAVWLSSGMYEHTLSGLVRCYVAALPFLRNTLMGDLFWSGMLFGAWALVGAARRAAVARATA